MTESYLVQVWADYCKRAVESQNRVAAIYQPVAAPITEQPMSVYFAETEDKPASNCRFCGTHEGSYHLDGCVRLNAAMIARDGPAAPKPAVVALPAVPTAHPAIAGLTFLGAVDHRLGAQVSHS
jgi:hypothetical protein